jgi:cell division protein FtsB
MLFGREKHDQNRVQELEAQLSERREELEAQLNHERLMHAQEIEARERELIRLKRQVEYLEAEVSKAQDVVYRLKAEEAIALERERRVKELAAAGECTYRIALQVFGYHGGWARKFIHKVLESPN